MEYLRVDPETDQPEQWLTEQVLLTLLNLPQQGLIGITSALLFSEHQQICAYWWREMESGEQHAKLVNEEMLRTTIGRTPLDTGYLPLHALRLGLSPQGKYWMLIYQPPQRYHLVIEHSEQSLAHIQMRLPGGLFFGIGDWYYLWAVKKGGVSRQTSLYQYPLPNIAEDGLLCFGQNTPPPVSWSGILPTLHLFLRSPFNGHWAQSKSSEYDGDIRERLLSLAASPRATFPEAELLPLPRYRNSGKAAAEQEPASLDTHLRRVVQHHF